MLFFKLQTVSQNLPAEVKLLKKLKAEKFSFIIDAFIKTEKPFPQINALHSALPETSLIFAFFNNKVYGLFKDKACGKRHGWNIVEQQARGESAIFKYF
jgi:hypothetical protein